VVLVLLNWVCYFLACTSLGVYIVIIAGWSSNSGYSLLGGIYALVQTVSYEVRLTLFYFLLCLRV
jgi:NADH-ubiquinone oxidoreductase chain 1